MVSRLLLVLALCFGIGACDFILPCFIDRYADLRSPEGRFDLEAIPDGCTHLIVGFAKIIPEYDFNVFTYEDFDFYKRVNAIKKTKPGLKTLISVGGPQTESWMFSAALKNQQIDDNFCTHLHHLVKKFDFDGLDIAWFYPTATDKEAYGRLLWCFERGDLIVTATVSGNPYVIANSYDPAVMATTNLDFINVMSFDYHDEHGTKTGMIAPLYAGLGDSTNLTVSYALNLWAELGFPRNKTVMGISAHGRGWHLDDPNNSQLGAPAHPSAPFGGSNTEGLIAYYEVCEALYRDNHTHSWSDYQKVPYILDNGTFWSYEDEHSIQYKMEFVKKNGLAGAFLYTLDLDDFKGVCPPAHIDDQSVEPAPSNKHPFALVNAMESGLKKTYPTPPPTPPPSPPTSQDEPYYCGFVADGPGPFYEQDGQDCHKYYYCHVGNYEPALHLSCGDLYFDRQRQECVYYAYSECPLPPTNWNGTGLPPWCDACRCDIPQQFLPRACYYCPCSTQEPHLSVKLNLTDA